MGNSGPANLDVMGANVFLGTKPIRQVDGTALADGHFAGNAELLLQYSAVDSGYWTVMAGARGPIGLTGPPDGAFSLDDDGDLLFTPTGSAVASPLGKARPHYAGTYSGQTEYYFLNLVTSGTSLYLHIGLPPTTGVGVSNSATWVQYSRDGTDGTSGTDPGVVVAFDTSTTAADPGNGDVRFNHATPSSVTRIYLDDLDDAGNNLSAWVHSWDNYGSDPNAQLVIKGTGANTYVLVYNLTGVTNLTGYNRLTVSHVAGNTLPSGGDLISIVPLLRGDDGTSGANVQDASETQKGVAEIANNTEADDGTDDDAHHDIRQDAARDCPMGAER